MLLAVHAVIDDGGIQTRVLVRTYLVHVQTDFLTEFLHIRYSTEDADRTGECGRLCVDIIRCTGDIVTARSGIIAH